jgi:hypothetical protein
VRRVLVQARVPRHEIWEWLDFSRRFYKAYAIDSPDKLCQLSRHSQDQVRFRNCEHCCRKEWNPEVSFLAGPEGGWINSQVVRPNGGFVY